MERKYTLTKTYLTVTIRAYLQPETPVWEPMVVLHEEDTQEVAMCRHLLELGLWTSITTLLILLDNNVGEAT